jgi:hypothetical protein
VIHGINFHSLADFRLPVEAQAIDRNYPIELMFLQSSLASSTITVTELAMFIHFIKWTAL